MDLKSAMKSLREIKKELERLEFENDSSGLIIEGQDFPCSWLEALIYMEKGLALYYLKEK